MPVPAAGSFVGRLVYVYYIKTKTMKKRTAQQQRMISEEWEREKKALVWPALNMKTCKTRQH